ncbi:MAG: hypothetical protein LBU67_01795 [Oscillospiraceae bacterium]|nr:hypothetical protein [Oscillospiraceae bacterium]
MLVVKTLEPTRKNLRAFIRLAYDVYRDDPYWVPPLVFDQMRTLRGINNGLFENGPHRFFMAYDGDKPVARALAGVDYKLVERTGVKEGYLSLFESYDNPAYAQAVFDAAAQYLRGLGMDIMIGPNPATFDDFNKGMLVEGFDGSPVLFNAYNRPCYIALFENYGFTKYCDHYAYQMQLADFDVDKYSELAERAAGRFGFTVREINLKGNILPEMQDVATCVAEAFPKDWNLLPPTTEDIYTEFKQMKSFVNPRYAVLAYAGNRPVGFALALPDYNQLIKKMRGRLTPAGIYHFVTGRKKIDQVRAVMQFVVPDYQNKAVNAAMIYHAYKNALADGIRWAEASTIDEKNAQSNITLEKAGFTRYRVYRQYVYKLR